MPYPSRRIERIPERYFEFDGQVLLSMFQESTGSTPAILADNIGLWRSNFGPCELSQSTAGNRPVLVQNLGSQELGVQFDTSSKRLVGNAAMQGFLNSAVAATLVSVVTLPASGGATKRMVQFSRTVADSSKFCSLIVSGDAMQLQSRRATADTVYTTSTSALFTAGVMYIRIDSVDPSTGLNKVQLYDPINGLLTVVSQTAGWTTGATFDANDSANVILGGNSGADPFTNGIIWYMAGYRSLLSSTAESDLVDYLVRRWSIE